MEVKPEKKEEGIGGATMASNQFTRDTTSLKYNIQIGDPFLERLLCEACQEIYEKKWLKECKIWVQEDCCVRLWKLLIEVEIERAEFRLYIIC